MELGMAISVLLFPAIVAVLITILREDKKKDS